MLVEGGEDVRRMWALPLASQRPDTPLAPPTLQLMSLLVTLVTGELFGCPGSWSETRPALGDMSLTHRHPDAGCPKICRTATCLLKYGVCGCEGGTLRKDACGKQDGVVALHLQRSINAALMSLQDSKQNSAAETLMEVLEVVSQAVRHYSRRRLDSGSGY